MVLWTIFDALTQLLLSDLDPRRPPPGATHQLRAVAPGLVDQFQAVGSQAPPQVHEVYATQLVLNLLAHLEGGVRLVGLAQ